jgi:hypothetical protein
VSELGVDLLTVVSHKFYGPKGIGILYVRDGVNLEKQQHGAGHERGLRAGTESILLIVGLARALEMATNSELLKEHENNMRRTRDLLWTQLKSRIPELRLNGHEVHRLPNTLSVSFPKIKAHDLLHLLRNQVAASPGAACHSNEVKPSHVLKAMKIPQEYVLGTVRFSTGRGTTEEEILRAVDLIVAAYLKLRATTPTTPTTDRAKNIQSEQNIVVTPTSTRKVETSAPKNESKVSNDLTVAKVVPQVNSQPSSRSPNPSAGTSRIDSQTKTLPAVTNPTDTNLNLSVLNRTTPEKESPLPPRSQTPSQPYVLKSPTTTPTPTGTPTTRTYAASVGSSPRIIHSPRKSEGQDTSYRKSLEILVTHSFKTLKNLADPDNQAKKK